MDAVLHCTLDSEPVTAVCTAVGVDISRVDSVLEQDTSQRRCLNNCRHFANVANRNPDCARRVLSFADLLGGRVDRERGLVQLVHCPRSARGGSRRRCDVVMSVGDRAVLDLELKGSSSRTALDIAETWVAMVSRFCVVQNTRHYFVMINPVSGAGHAVKRWEIVKAVWNDLPWISFEELVTSRANEGEERVRQMNLNDYDGIVIVSGDGLVYEALNGLASRPDSDKALAMPIGHIPGGSGNGLAQSILHSSGESFGVLDAGFLIAKGGTQTLHLSTVSTAGQPPKTSFLSLAGGVIADIDLGSESLRFMGNLRFSVYAVMCVARPRPLEAQLVYWPEEADKLPRALCGDPPSLDEPLPPGPWVTVDGVFTFFWGVNTAWASSDSHVAPGLALGSKSWSLICMRSASRVDLAKCLLALDSGKHVNQPGVEVFRCHAFRIHPRGVSQFSLDGEHVPFGPVQLWPSQREAVALGALPFPAPSCSDR